MRKINLLNGDCALDGWRQSALPGEALVWRENYLHGRLPEAADTAAFNSVRAEDLHTISNGATVAEIFAELESLHKTLLELNKDDQLILWFDYCPFDRTMLARILSLLADAPNRPQISLIFKDVVWNRDAFLQYADSAIVLTDADLSYGREQWRQYCAGEVVPEELMARFAR